MICSHPYMQRNMDTNIVFSISARPTSLNLNFSLNARLTHQQSGLKSTLSSLNNSKSCSSSLTIKPGSPLTYGTATFTLSLRIRAFKRGLCVVRHLDLRRPPKHSWWPSLSSEFSYYYVHNKE